MICEAYLLFGLKIFQTGLTAMIKGEGFASGQELGGRVDSFFIEFCTLVPRGWDIDVAAKGWLSKIRALTIGLTCVNNLVLVWAMRIREDPNVMKLGVSEQFQFAEVHILSFLRD